MNNEQLADGQLFIKTPEVRPVKIGSHLWCFYWFLLTVCRVMLAPEGLNIGRKYSDTSLLSSIGAAHFAVSNPALSPTTYSSIHSALIMPQLVIKC